ncbi:MAG: hypothetical protein GF383_02160 [Candidatus Lokiarchaeota archaeon]|nr:hypothetical protein [Candidatus Lokiarchaeota archaeon]MBD3338218.1 hypothetical protein [Candidatus Lokiarchaeota archaeon]
MKKKQLVADLAKLKEKNQFLRNNQIFLAKLITDIITLLETKFPMQSWTKEEQTKLLSKFFLGKWDTISDDKIKKIIKNNLQFEKFIKNISEAAS